MNSVVLIGAGNLATSLAKALHGAGISVSQVYSRNIENAKALALVVNAEPIDTFKFLRTNAEIYIIALPDDVIPQVAKVLPSVGGVVVHTSGSTPLSALEEVRAKGFGVFYPFQTFSRERAIPFQNIPICLEANSGSAYDKLEQLAARLSRVVVPMDSEQRKWLHLSGVFACNFTNHMMAIAYRLTREHQISFDVVKPLVEETLRKSFEGDPALFQTGPAIRNDRKTLEKHIQMLSVLGLADLYKELSLSIQNFAKNKRNSFTDDMG